MSLCLSLCLCACVDVLSNHLVLQTAIFVRVYIQGTCVNVGKTGPRGRKCRVEVEARAPWDTTGGLKVEALVVDAAEVT